MGIPVLRGSGLEGFYCSIVSAFRLGQKLILMNRRRLCFRNDIDVKNGNVNLLQSFVTLPLPKCTNNFPVRKNSAMVGALMFRTIKCSRGSSSLYLWRFMGCTPICFTTKCKLVRVKFYAIKIQHKETMSYTRFSLVFSLIKPRHFNRQFVVYKTCLNTRCLPTKPNMMIFIFQHKLVF